MSVSKDRKKAAQNPMLPSFALPVSFLYFLLGFLNLTFEYEMILLYIVLSFRRKNSDLAGAKFVSIIHTFPL